MEGRPTTAAKIVGRVPEQHRLREALSPGGGARVALVGGEAGIGKTRLVVEALDAGTPDGALVLRLRGDALRRGRPYGALLGALEPHVRDWTEVPHTLRSRTWALARVLGPVAPVLAPAARTEPPTSDDDGEVVPAEELELAAIDLLRHLTPDTGALVVVCDDLHWFDAETVAVLHELIVGAAGLDDAVVLGTYRPEGVVSRSPLAAVVNLVERHPDAANLRLGPLDLDEVAEVAGQVLGDHVSFRDVKALHQRSGGNPFFLEELMCAVDAERGPGGVADLPLPWTIAELLRDQLHGLTDDERTLVEIAAVLGQRIPFDLLARVSDIDERDLIHRLRGIVAAGLMVEDEVDVFAFRHALVCETVSAGLLGRERRRLHEAAVEALLADDEPDDGSVAHHARHAGRFDVMLDAVRRAAEDSLRRGVPSRALEFAEMGLSEDPDDLGLHEVATRSAWLMGALDDAREHAEAWVRVAVAAGDRGSEARARRTLVRIAFDIGDEVSHLGELDRLVQLLDGLHDAEHAHDRAAGLADVAQAHMLAGRSERAREFAELATEAAEACGDERVRVQALVERWSCGEDVDGVAAAELAAAVEQAEALGDHLTASRGLNNLVHRVPISERRHVIERMRDHAQRVGFTVLSAFSYADNLADLASIAADRPELERWVDSALRWSRLSQSRKHSTWMRSYRVLLAVEEADPDRAELAAMIGSTEPVPLIELMAVSGAGDTKRANELIRSGLMPTGKHEYALGVSAWIAESLLRAGVEPDRVRDTLETLVPASERDGPVWAAATAFVAVADGDLDAATTAMSAVDDDVHRWLQGQLHVALAESYDERGDTQAALEQLERARACLQRWPGWRRDRADELRQRLERRAGRESADVLSSRETEVAALVAEGLTNAQIAERLFIARKTAAVHVSNILAKLGMRGRAEIAAWAVREGLTAADRAS